MIFEKHDVEQGMRDALNLADKREERARKEGFAMGLRAVVRWMEMDGTAMAFERAKIVADAVEEDAKR